MSCRCHRSKSVRRDDRRDLTQGLTAHPVSSRGKRPPVVIGESEAPPTQLPPQDPIMIRAYLPSCNIARFHQFDFAAEIFQSSSDKIGKFAKAFEITAAGLDGNQRSQAFEQRGLFFFRQGKNRLVRLSVCCSEVPASIRVKASLR